MKKWVSLFVLLGLTANVFANECLTDKESIPGSKAGLEKPKMQLGNLGIYMWKFSCTQNRAVGLALVAKNFGNTPISFDWDDISLAKIPRSRVKVREKEVINANDFTVDYYWDKADKKLLEDYDTRVAYQNSLNVTVPRFAFGSDTSGSNGSKLSVASGLWYDPALDGTGFSFIDTAVGMGVTYYGYDKNGGKNWLNATSFGPKAGEIEVGKDYTLDLNQPGAGNGGKFDTKPTGPASGTTPWGTMTIKFSDCKSATATLKGLDGTQVFNLTKLSGNKGAECVLK